MINEPENYTNREQNPSETQVRADARATEENRRQIEVIMNLIGQLTEIERQLVQFKESNRHEPKSFQKHVDGAITSLQTTLSELRQTLESP